MSYWTHITSCISLDTNIEESRTELRKQMKKHLKDAPKITGSEKNASVFINIPEGHNVYTTADCDHCPYKDSIKWIKRGEFECTHPDDYECKEGRFQTSVVISIQGDLRDRMVAQTQEEFDAFLKYLDERFYIRDYSINIEGV